MLLAFPVESGKTRTRAVPTWSAFVTNNLLLGCLRAFTLIPSTYLIVIALPFFAPVPLFVLTVIGILVSSALIYWFSEALHIEELFNSSNFYKFLLGVLIGEGTICALYIFLGDSALRFFDLK